MARMKLIRARTAIGRVNLEIDSRLPFGASPVGRRRGNDNVNGGNDNKLKGSYGS